MIEQVHHLTPNKVAVPTALPDLHRKNAGQTVLAWHDQLITSQMHELQVLQGWLALRAMVLCKQCEWCSEIGLCPASKRASSKLDLSYSVSTCINQRLTRRAANLQAEATEARGCTTMIDESDGSSHSNVVVTLMKCLIDPSIRWLLCSWECNAKKVPPASGSVAVDRVCAWNLRCQLGVLVRMPRYSIPLSEFWRYVEERRRTMRLDGQDGHL